jgi:hypothetical protein
MKDRLEGYNSALDDVDFSALEIFELARSWDVGRIDIGKKGWEEGDSLCGS